MLVVREKKHRVHETIEVDEYVPFTAEFGKDESSPLYWRGGDGRLSLVEIGLTKIGDICSITLTSISQESVVHHYFIGEDYAWCMTFTMEGDMTFGFKPECNE